MGIKDGKKRRPGPINDFSKNPKRVVLITGPRKFDPGGFLMPRIQRKWSQCPTLRRKGWAKFDLHLKFKVASFYQPINVKYNVRTRISRARRLKTACCKKQRCVKTQDLRPCTLQRNIRLQFPTLFPRFFIKMVVFGPFSHFCFASRAR